MSGASFARVFDFEQGTLDTGGVKFTKISGDTLQQPTTYGLNAALAAKTVRSATHGGQFLFCTRFGTPVSGSMTITPVGNVLTHDAPHVERPQWFHDSPSIHTTLHDKYYTSTVAAPAAKVGELALHVDLLLLTSTTPGLYRTSEVILGTGPVEFEAAGMGKVRVCIALPTVSCKMKDISIQQNNMTVVYWRTDELESWVGKRVYFELEDDSSDANWGHLCIDNFKYFEGAPR